MNRLGETLTAFTLAEAMVATGLVGIILIPLLLTSSATISSRVLKSRNATQVERNLAVMMDKMVDRVAKTQQLAVPAGRWNSTTQFRFDYRDTLTGKRQLGGYRIVTQGNHTFLEELTAPNGAIVFNNPYSTLNRSDWVQLPATASFEYCGASGACGTSDADVAAAKWIRLRNFNFTASAQESFGGGEAVKKSYNLPFHSVYIDSNRVWSRTVGPSTGGDTPLLSVTRENDAFGGTGDVVDLSKVATNGNANALWGPPRASNQATASVTRSVLAGVDVQEIGFNEQYRTFVIKTNTGFYTWTPSMKQARFVGVTQPYGYLTQPYVDPTPDPNTDPRGSGNNDGDDSNYYPSDLSYVYNGHTYTSRAEDLMDGDGIPDTNATLYRNGTPVFQADYDAATRPNVGNGADYSLKVNPSDWSMSTMKLQKREEVMMRVSHRLFLKMRTSGRKKTKKGPFGLIGGYSTWPMNATDEAYWTDSKGQVHSIQAYNNCYSTIYYSSYSTIYYSIDEYNNRCAGVGSNTVGRTRDFEIYAREDHKATASTLDIYHDDYGRDKSGNPTSGPYVSFLPFVNSINIWVSEDPIETPVSYSNSDEGWIWWIKPRYDDNDSFVGYVQLSCRAGLHLYRADSEYNIPESCQGEVTVPSFRINFDGDPRAGVHQFYVGPSLKSKKHFLIERVIKGGKGFWGKGWKPEYRPWLMPQWDGIEHVWKRLAQGLAKGDGASTAGEWKWGADEVVGYEPTEFNVAYQDRVVTITPLGYSLMLKNLNAGPGGSYTAWPVEEPSLIWTDVDENRFVYTKMQSGQVRLYSYKVGSPNERYLGDLPTNARTQALANQHRFYWFKNPDNNLGTADADMLMFVDASDNVRVHLSGNANLPPNNLDMDTDSDPTTGNATVPTVNGGGFGDIADSSRGGVLSSSFTGNSYNHATTSNPPIQNHGPHQSLGGPAYFSNFAASWLWNVVWGRNMTQLVGYAVSPSTGQHTLLFESGSNGLLDSYVASTKDYSINPHKTTALTGGGMNFNQLVGFTCKDNMQACYALNGAGARIYRYDQTTNTSQTPSFNWSVVTGLVPSPLGLVHDSVSDQVFTSSSQLLSRDGRQYFVVQGYNSVGQLGTRIEVRLTALPTEPSSTANDLSELRNAIPQRKYSFHLNTVSKRLTIADEVNQKLYVFNVISALE